MEQLPLEVHLADYALFDTFYAGPNAPAVHALSALAQRADSGVLWICGAPESGKTHLLQAGVSAAAALGHRSAYLPLGPDFELSPEALEGLDAFDWISIDDVDSVAGKADWEEGLFRLFEQSRQCEGRLVLAARHAPRNCGFRLPDLESRFASGAFFRLRSLGDEQKQAALRLRAGWRGLDLPEDTAAYLISRVDRGCGQLFALLDTLDREALAAQRKLTVPFVKSILDRR